MAGVPLLALRWLWWRAWFPFGAVVAAAAWQAWHLAASTFTLRCRRGTWRHGPSLCVAGVALGDIDVRSAWQACHLWHWAGSGGALGSRLAPWSPRLFAWQARHLATSIFTLRGRRGTWRHGPSLCMAGVALGIDAHSAWQACHFGTGLALVARLVPVWPFAWQAWYLATSTFTLRGRRGTWRHRPSLCVGHGTLRHRPSLCAAGVALGDRPSLCVAGVECCTMHLCISMHLYASLCISMYLYVSLCISMYLYVSLMCLYVSLCM